MSEAEHVCLVGSVAPTWADATDLPDRCQFSVRSGIGSTLAQVEMWRSGSADRSMAMRVTRRNVLGGLASLAALSARPLRGFTSPKETPSDALSRRDEKPKLTVAMLDAHWDAMQDLVGAYADAQGIKIDTTPLSYDELYSQLNLALTQQAATFDVISLEDPWIPQFASFLTPLDASSDLMDVLVPVCASVSRYPPDALPCALPWLGDAQFFGMQSEWLNRAEVRPPATWDETVSTASDMSAAIDPESELSAFGMSTLNWQDLVRSYLPILQGYGKALVDEKTNVPQLDTPEALAAMEAFEALVQLSPPESSAVGEPTNVERFGSGQIAMMSNFWSSNLLASRLVEQKSATGPITISLQPAQPGVTPRTMTGIWLLGIPLGSALPDEAWAFFEWIVGNEAQGHFPERALPPVRIDAYTDPMLVDAVPELPGLLSMLQPARPRPRSPFYPQLEQLLGAELGNVVSGKKSGTQALKDANVAIREFLVREGVLEA
jgi:multiple sugar transport system substrate-binding protein